MIAELTKRCQPMRKEPGPDHAQAYRQAEEASKDFLNATANCPRWSRTARFLSRALIRVILMVVGDEARKGL